MSYAISGYFQDTEGQWVAKLLCGHHQRLQHNSAKAGGAWFSTQMGRDDKIGVLMVCQKCIAGAPRDDRLADMHAG
jgi:Protein of unknown function (DUF3565)